MTPPRLEHPFGQLIDRDAPVTFEFEGETVQGYEGDNVASALIGQGRWLISRSFKYHRSIKLLPTMRNKNIAMILARITAKMPVALAAPILFDVNSPIKYGKFLVPFPRLTISISA